MKKTDLKIGHIVKLTTGAIGIVLSNKNNKLNIFGKINDNKNFTIKLSNYNNDLICKYLRADIDAVYEAKSLKESMKILFDEKPKLKLLWTRHIENNDYKHKDIISDILSKLDNEYFQVNLFDRFGNLISLDELTDGISIGINIIKK